ncbi:RWD domain-containing protein 1 isoform X1 [Monodon monoceros]|nr:RWD domain-containing protein 1 isoform X1 [Monodon monoceros]
MPDRVSSLSLQIPSGRGTGGPQARPNESNAELGSRRRQALGCGSAGLAWLWASGLSAGDSAPAPALQLPALPARRGPGCRAPPGCLGDPWAAARAAMTDYGEEQRNELEALESIYPDSFTVLSENPPSFTITVTSEAGENDETVQTTLKFTYSEKYPDEAPLYEIFSQLNLDDNDVSDILKLLALQTEENLGMVMIFTLVTAVQEKLNEIVDQIKTRQEEEKKQKEKEAEEAEKQLFHGTPVTIENFLSWKAKFDAELLEIKKKRMKEEEQAGKNKLSGRQLFETDHNLDTSDIQFLEDAGNNVEVDESLFQEMDDLELEDDEDDPDYNPADRESDLTD